MHDVQLLPIRTIGKAHQLRPAIVAYTGNKISPRRFFIDAPMMRFEKDVGAVDRKAPSETRQRANKHRNGARGFGNVVV